MSTIETLARWYNTFNVWQWPGDYPVPKPAGFDGLRCIDPNVDTDKRRVIEPHMQSIRTIIPHKEIMRDWHIRVHKRTPENFTEWWEKVYEPCATPVVVEAKATLSGRPQGANHD